MRPDKKKNRHHDSVKCENKAKQKASEKAKKEEKSQNNQKKQSAPTKDQETSSSKNENVSTNTSTPEEEVFEKRLPDPKYSKRSVTSNWTKYEIPSDDDDNSDECGTGPEFQFVMEKSAQAADHLMLSSEKQWQKEEPEIANQQQNEHFALNLKNLETALDCIPLYEYDMFHMKKCEIDVSSKKNILVHAYNVLYGGPFFI